MKRTYTDQEMIRILNQELVIPEKVDQGMQDAYRKLGIQRKGRVSFARRHKMLRVLAAAAVLAAGSSLVVAAANKFLTANLVKEESSMTYDLAIDREQKEAHEIEVTPTYMPAGYALGAENTPYGGKWHNNETGGTVTIIAWNAAELDQQIRMGNSDDLTHGLKEENLKKEIEINGMKAALFLSESRYTDSDKTTKNMMLFNEEEGYLVEIFDMNNTLPMEETIKIAEGLDIQVLDSTVPYATDEEIEALLAEQKANQESALREWTPELLADNNFFSTGEELKIPFGPDENHGIKTDDIRYTVESIEIKDALPVSEYPVENYYDFAGEMADWINEDGTLKAHERYKHSYDENGKEVGEPTVETVNSKFVVAHMKVKNHNTVNEYDNDVTVCPYIHYLDVNKDGISKSYAADWKYSPANEGYHLQTDGFPVYFDKIYHTDGIKRVKDFHFVPMEPGEELEYTLVYVVDEDQLDRAFFQFYSEYNGWKAPEGGNDYVYVKVTQ